MRGHSISSRHAEGDRASAGHKGAVVVFCHDSHIVIPLKESSAGIDRQLAARRAKLMKELRERIAEVERRVALFNSGRAALWGQVETAFNARMLAKWNP